MIWQRTEFVEDETGDEEFPVKQVDRLEAREGDEKRFIGRATLNMQTPMGVQQIPISFEIDAADVDEAFNSYSEAARPRIDEVRERVREQIQQMRQRMQQQQQQQEGGRIVTPGQGGDSGNILRMEDLTGGKES